MCNVSGVTDLVAKQVGFSAILLDSKCYPIPSSSGTCGIDFWKGTRMILAASKSLYSLISEDDTIDTPPPKKKKQESLILERLATLD